MGCGAIKPSPHVAINIARKATEIAEPSVNPLPGILLADAKKPAVQWITEAVEAFTSKAGVKMLHLNVPITGPLFEPYSHMDVIVGISALHQKEKETPGMGSKSTFASKVVDTIPVYFAFWDTPTTEEAYAKMLTTYCEGAQAMVLCFSLSSRKSFESAVSKYYEHVAKVIHAGDCEGDLPLVLAGVGELQANSREVSFDEAQKQAEKWKATCYIEVDPDDNENVASVLNDLSRTCITIDSQKAQKDASGPAKTLRIVRATALKEIKDLRAAALRRLPEALTCVEKGDSAAKQAIKDLLAAEEFTLGLSNVQLRELRQYCSKRLEELGAPLQSAFEREGVADRLGKLIEDRHGIACRQDEVVPAPTVRERRVRAPQAEPSDELVYIAVLVLLGEALDSSFQAAVAANCGGGSQASTPPKVYAKMRHKLANEHIKEAKPRAACNLDVLRCVVTYGSPSDLQTGCEALVRHFGSPASARNGFRADIESPHGFRQLMLNWRFTTGKTYGEVRQESEALWVKLKESHAATHNCRKVFDAAIAWLQRDDLKDKEVVMICETQLALRENSERWKIMELHERIAKSANQEILWKDSH
jgi:GTPase SAR1 family protein